MTKFPALIFAHRSNEAKWIDEAIKQGANAIESDVYLHGHQIWAAHDFLPTTGGTKLHPFLKYVSEKLVESKQVVLWLFDLKTTMSPEKFQELRTAVNANFPNDVFRFYCVTDDTKYLVEPYLPQFEAMEGINYDADFANVNSSVESALAWRDACQIANFIYSVGIDSLFPIDVQNELKQAVGVRDLRQDFGVYTWTYDKEVTATTILKTLKLNGIMGNMNEPFGNLPSSIEAGRVANFRLALRSDGIHVFRR